MGSREEWAREFRRTHSLRSFRPPVVVISIGEDDSVVEEDKAEKKRLRVGRERRRIRLWSALDKKER